MRRLTWPWWLALVLLIIVFALIRLPASMVGSLISAQSAGKFNLAGAQGSIWQGSAQPVLDGEALAEQLSWQWRPKDLLQARLGYDIRLDAGQAALSLGLGEISLRQFDLALAAAPLFKLSEKTRNYGLSGQLRLSGQEMHLRGGKPEGQLSLDWLGASSSLAPAVRPLGDYRLNALPAGSGWQLQLSTLSGQLQLNGNGNWQAAQGLQAEVALQAAPGAASALAPFLSQVGAGAPEAERRLRFSLR